MVREKWKKDKNGQTDREIAFTILLNQIRNSIGLTKRQVAEAVERATTKDRDGVRKRVSRLLGNQSSLNGLIQMEKREGRKIYKIILANLEDVARLYNFLRPLEWAVKLKEISDFIRGYMEEYIDQVVDFLYLWNPYVGPYCLPDALLERYADTDALDYHPKQHVEVGLNFFKIVARDFCVFDNLLNNISERSEVRFFELISDFTPFRKKLLESKIRDIWESDNYQYEHIFISGKSFRTRAIPLNDEIIGDDNIANELRWFFDIWKDSWEEGSVINKRGHIKDGDGKPEGKEIDILKGMSTTYGRETAEQIRTYLQNEDYIPIWKKQIGRESTYSISENFSRPLSDAKLEIYKRLSIGGGLKITEGRVKKVPRELMPDFDQVIYPDVEYIPEGGYYKLRNVEGELKARKTLLEQADNDKKDQPKSHPVEVSLDKWIWKDS